MRCPHARRVQRRKERLRTFEAFLNMREPHIPRLNGAETARSAVTTNSMVTACSAITTNSMVAAGCPFTTLRSPGVEDGCWSLLVEHALRACPPRERWKERCERLSDCCAPRALLHGRSRQSIAL